MRISRALALLALLCALVAPAHAMTEEEERAKAHFLAGQSYYDQASYADALKEFNEAYRLSQKPALLYNVARCYEALGRFAEAVGMLQRYLADEPETTDRAAIEERIRNLQERQKQADKAPPPVVIPPPPIVTAPPPPPEPRHRQWTWIVGGAGVALLGAALGTGVASQLDYNDLEKSCPGPGFGCTGKDSSNIDRGKQLSVATDVLWPIGAAAVVGGVVLFFVEGRHPRRHAAVGGALHARAW